MTYSDMHTHGRFSDGKGSFIEFVLSAAKKNITSLGFSDHSPVPLKNEWAMKKEALDFYFKEISEAKKSSPKGLEIYAGLELDYIKGIDVKEYIGFFDLPLDYYIGSVHYIYSELLDEYFQADGSLEDFEYMIEKGFEGDAASVYQAYYSNVREMISSYRPAVAAHIDLITKNNEGNKYFDTRSKKYLEEIEKTLDIIKLFGTIVEINTGGMSRGYMDNPYPSDYVLDKCISKAIPVTLNSDAHTPDALAFQFGAIIKKLKIMGLTEIIQYKKGAWVPVQL